jgi:hypothetical protein
LWVQFLELKSNTTAPFKSVYHTLASDLCQFDHLQEVLDQFSREHPGARVEPNHNIATAVAAQLEPRNKASTCSPRWKGLRLALIYEAGCFELLPSSKLEPVYPINYL